MKTHITTLNNMAGTASLAHRRVLKVAQSIGCHEMGLSFYHLKPDYAKEIDKRLDGIIAPLNYGDIVIFQYPSWIGVNYDESFVNKIKSYRDTKLIIFVQDIQKLMFDSEQAILDMEIKTLNKADLLILPSKKMHRYLKENGLDEKPVIYQTIWDMPSDICFVDHAVTRCFHFAGNYNRFPFLAEYHGKTPIYQYDANKPDRENDDSFCWRGYFEQEKLMHELSKGGFGLVWSDDEYFDRYYSMNQPYKLGTNLAAGIPVIVKRGCVHEKFVERNGLGYAVDTLDEADKLVQSITDAEYIKLYHNVKNIQKLILDGAYTRKTLAILIVAIMSLDNTRKLSPKKINIWTVTIMMIIAAVQAYHKTQTLMYRVSGDELIWNKIIVFIQLIAGMLIVVYMCDRATKYGIGGKVSVFMVNIVSGMMTMFTGKPLEKLALPVAIGVAEIAVMIVLETTEKRIAVQRVSINNIYADKNYIAYKLNPVGATPLMFASAAFLLPQFMCNGLHYLFPDNADIQWWMDNMRLTSPLGIVVYMVIICLLTIIFSMVMLSPGRTADDLLKSGDSIQDIYAGKSTKRYLIGTVLSFSVISSIIICICQGGPLFLQFGGYVDASLAMLPCSIMMTTGLWISLYREAEVYRNMDRYHTFI